MKSVITYSGGLDSTVLLYHLRNEGHELKALSVNYSQRHYKELEVAKDICNDLAIDCEIADLSGLSSILTSSSLTNVALDIPHGHYEEDMMKQTVVPNRNMLLIAVATAWAIDLKFDQVAYAAHTGDHAVYPDCRAEFVESLAESIRLADWHEVTLLRPFGNMTKADIVKRGVELSVPMERTWSCYKGEDLHCGHCGTCVERREAFYLAGIGDNTPYAESALSVNEMVKNNWGKKA